MNARIVHALVGLDRVHVKRRKIRVERVMVVGIVLHLRVKILIKVMHLRRWWRRQMGLLLNAWWHWRHRRRYNHLIVVVIAKGGMMRMRMMGVVVIVRVLIVHG